MLDRKIMTETADRLRATSVDAEMEAVAAKMRERAKLANAIDRGRQRLVEIGRELAAVRDGRVVEPSDAADAMLAGTAIDRKSEADLKEEIDALNAGLRELQKREDMITAAEAEQRSAAVSKLSRCVDPLIAEMERDVDRLVAELVHVYAVASAVEVAVGSNQARILARRLEDPLARMLSDNSRYATVPVPAAIVETMAAGHHAMGRLGRHCPTHIRAPERRVDPAIFGLASRAQ